MPVPVANAPNRCWVADFAHVTTWSGSSTSPSSWTFSRRTVGWSASTANETRLVLEAPKVALWQRDRAGSTYQQGELIHDSDAGSQYTSLAPAERLDRAGIAASRHRSARSATPTTVSLFVPDPARIG
ncbi:DDE-type integrase/transposase/recombinase [Streptomyces sp. NPDC056304]|uniref:DDE-type integrase/transposase/recombinase n=1 Tax=Streptomyces sp. NPDC056304 TaxID=3345778 RepID=UPI0035E32527